MVPLQVAPRVCALSVYNHTPRMHLTVVRTSQRTHAETTPTQNIRLATSARHHTNMYIERFRDTYIKRRGIYKTADHVVLKKTLHVLGRSPSPGSRRSQAIPVSLDMERFQENLFLCVSTWSIPEATAECAEYIG